MSEQQAPGTSGRLTFSWVVSLVRTSAVQTPTAPDSTDPDPGSGTSTNGSSASCDPARPSSKTSRVGRRGGCARCGPGCMNLAIERAPSSWPRPTSEPRTDDSACSSSLWPTAAARDHKGPHMPAATGTREGGPCLGRAVLQPWPKPTANRYGTTNNGSPHDGRTAYATAGTPSLDTLIMRERSCAGMVLNPDWVETLMGYPIGWTDVGPPAGAKRSTRGNRPARSRRSAARTGSTDSTG